MPWQSDPVVNPPAPTASAPSWQSDPVIEPPPAPAPAPAWAHDPIVEPVPPAPAAAATAAAVPHLGHVLTPSLMAVNPATGNRSFQDQAFAEVEQAGARGPAARAILAKHQDQVMRAVPTEEQQAAGVSHAAPVQYLNAAEKGVAQGAFDVAHGLARHAGSGNTAAVDAAFRARSDRMNAFLGTDPESYGQKVAGAVGGMLPAVAGQLLGGPVAAGVVGGVQGMGAEARELAPRTDISDLQREAAVLGMGAVQGVASMVNLPVAGRIGAPVARAAEPVVGRAAGRLIGAGVGQAVEAPAFNAANTIAGNVVGRAAGVAPPDRGITEGAGESALVGLGTAPFMAPATAVHMGAEAQARAAHEGAVKSYVADTLTKLDPGKPVDAAGVALAPRPKGEPGYALRALESMHPRGADGVTYFSGGGRSDGNGFVDPGSGQVFVNADRPAQGLAAILAHEVLGHVAPRSDGDVAGALGSFRANNPALQEGAAAAYERDLGRPLSPAIRTEEGTARAIEDAFARPDAARKLAALDPGLAGRVGDAAAGLLDRLTGGNAAKLRLWRRQMGGLEVLAEYGKAKTGEVRAAAEGEEGVLDRVDEQLGAHAGEQARARNHAEASAEEDHLDRVERENAAWDDARSIERDRAIADNAARMRDAEGAAAAADRPSPRPSPGVPGEGETRAAVAAVAPGPDVTERADLMAEDREAARRAAAMRVSPDRLRQLAPEQLRQVAAAAGVHADAPSTTIPRIIDAQHRFDLEGLSSKELWDRVRATGLRAGSRQQNIESLLAADRGGTPPPVLAAAPEASAPAAPGEPTAAAPVPAPGPAAEQQKTPGGESRSADRGDVAPLEAAPKVQLGGRTSAATSGDSVPPAAGSVNKNSPDASTGAGSSGGLPSPGGTDRAAVATDAQSIPRADRAVKGKAAAPAKTPFSKAAIERRLIDYHERTGGGFTQADEDALAATDAKGDVFTFHRRLPGEVKHYIEGNPAARRLFRVTEDSTRSGGADAFAALGDKYFDIADRVTGGRLRTAKESARAGNDPAVQFWAAVHDNLPSRAKDRPPQVGKDPAAMPAGSTFELNGHAFEVVEHEGGYRVLKDGDDYPVTPVEAFEPGEKIPVDRGTFEQGKAAGAEPAPPAAPQPKGTGDAPPWRPGQNRQRTGRPPVVAPRDLPAEDVPFSVRRGGQDDNEKAPTSDAGIFGQEILRPATGNKQGTLFHEPAEAPARAAAEKPVGSKNANDPRNTGTLFSIAGERSINNLPEEDRRTARGNLDAALRLDKRGTEDERIRLATGWFKNPYDGKWRYEIDDSRAKVLPRDEVRSWGTREDMRAGNDTTAALPEILDHPELFKAYPQLERTGVFLRADRGGGHFDPETGSIAVGYDRKAGTINRRTLLHEVQHAIQEIEGFAKGANTTLARQTPQYAEMVQRIREREGTATADDENLAADNAYRRFAGEIEARDTANRADKTAGDRGINFTEARRLARQYEALTRSEDYRREVGDPDRPTPPRPGSAMDRANDILNRIDGLGYNVFSRDQWNALTNARPDRPVDRGSAPYQSENVPPSDAIVRFSVRQGGGAAGDEERPAEDRSAYDRVRDVTLRAAHAAADTATLKPVPQIRRAAGEAAADAAVEHASARLNAPHLVNRILQQVDPEGWRDPAQTEKWFAPIVKDQILAEHQRTLDRAHAAREQGRTKEAEAAEALARDQAHAHPIGQYENDVAAAMADPAVYAKIKRFGEVVNPLQDTLYNELKGLDPNTPQPTRGKHMAVRTNLVGIDPDAPQPHLEDVAAKPFDPKRVTGNPSNKNVKRDRWDQTAAATGQYSTDPEYALTEVLRHRLNEATKVRLFKALDASGAAKLVDAADGPQEKINGADAVSTPVTVPVTDPETGRTNWHARKLLVTTSAITREVRDVLATDQRLPQSPIAKALTQVQLAQIADGVTHVKNIGSRVYWAQGATRSRLTDALKGNPVVGVPLTLYHLAQSARGVLNPGADTLTRLDRLSRIGALRGEHAEGGMLSDFRDWVAGRTGQEWVKGLSTGRALSFVDKAGRLTLDKFYDELVRRGDAADTDAGRRDFVNQVGQYNSRLLRPLARAARDSGLSPFVVAGQTMGRGAVKTALADPGFGATTRGRAAAARLTQLGMLASFASLPAVLNLLSTGTVGGRSGTPVGAWDTGGDDENGNRQVWDVAQMVGLRRGLRATGIDALANGLASGRDANEIGGQAFGDAAQSALHPWVGPAPATLFAALTGHRLDLRGKMEARKVPEGGLAQTAENFRAALASSNPLAYAAAKPAFAAAGMDRYADDEGYAGDVGKTFLKSPFSAAGVKGVRPAGSAAEDLAGRLVQERFGGDGLTADDERRIAVKRSLLSALKRDPDGEGKRAVEAAVAAGRITERDAAALSKKAGASPLLWSVRSLSAQDALRVYGRGTDDEKRQLLLPLYHKLAGGGGGMTAEDRAAALDRIQEDAGEVAPDVGGRIAFERELSAAKERAGGLEKAKQLLRQSIDARRAGDADRAAELRAQGMALRRSSVQTASERARLARLTARARAVHAIERQVTAGALDPEEANRRIARAVRPLAAAV